MFFEFRESPSQSAAGGAPSTAQPVHNGPWTAARLSCKCPCAVCMKVVLFAALTVLRGVKPQVYGYDDLQMLQTRIPLVSPSLFKTPNCSCWILFMLSFLQDYYSIPFPTPTTALTGREGSLTSNHYSGPSAADTNAMSDVGRSRSRQGTFLNLYSRFFR